MNKRVGGIITLAATCSLVASMMLSTPSFADGITIPGSIKVKEFKQLMKDRGMDLSGEDDSDGGIENRGTAIFVYTFAPLTEKQMEDMIYASAESRR